MKSSQEHFQDTACILGSEETFIDAFMVFWMFIDSSNHMSTQQKNQIGGLFKSVMPIRTEGKVSYFPLVQSLDKFYQKLKKLKIKNKITKIVIDSQNAENLLNRVMNDEKQTIPNQVYIIASSKHEKRKSLNLVQKYKDIDISVFRNITSVIEIAEKDVKKWVNKFQILRNMFPLEPNSFQSAFERRVKLYACRNLESDKYDLYLDQFKKLVQKELKINSQQRRIIQNALSQAANIKKEILKKQRKVQDLKIKAKNSTTEEQNQQSTQITEENQSISKDYESFINIMLTLYKGTSYFYEIINNGLKRIGQKQFPWQQLTLPFCFLHEAILYKYQHFSQKLLQQIASKKEYTLYRGGKMSSVQRTQIEAKYKQNPFCQCLSFTSASKSREKALKFLSSTQQELNKVNCLFKYIIKPPKKMDNPSFRKFLMQNFCQIQNTNAQNQDQVLLNSMTVGKVINIGRQKLTNSYENITVITIQIGSFEDLFINKENSSLYEDRNTHKQIVNHFKHTMELVLNFQEFSFSSAYELCNQMQKSYDYIKKQIARLTDECQIIGPNNDNKQLSQKRLSFFYSQQNYYSKLAQICRKMGNLTEAQIHAQNAINKYKQLENIDKNRMFRIHQQKLEQMYLKTSQILIQKHKFRQARQILTEKISQLQKEQNQAQRQRNRVIISRMKLDLGTVNFKQGKTEEAKKIFGQSSQEIENIFKSIDYEQLKQETFWLDWIKGWFTDADVSIFDGNQVYFEKRRKQRIQQATKLYGSQERLLYLKKSAHLLSHETTQAISKHKEYFNDSSQYEQIINDIKKKVDDRMDQNSDKNIKDSHLGVVVQCIAQEEQKKQQKNDLMNSYKKLRQEMDQNLIINQKTTLEDIRNQQKMISLQKQSIQQKLSQFWQNPDTYFQSPIDFQQQFSENFIEKQRQNRQVLLKHSDQVTIQQLSAYYKDSAKAIEKYIKDLQQWGYSESATKVLQQYNKLIKLYIEIDCKTDAQKKIAQVKRIAEFKKEDKYYELAVAYFFSGKICHNCTDRDFIYLERKDQLNGRRQKIDQLQKLDKYQQFRLQKAVAALEQFRHSQQYFQNALITKGKTVQSKEAYDAQPQQVELKIWKMKSLLVKFQLQRCKEAKSKLKDQILDLKAVIQSGLKKLKTSNVDEIQAQFKQTNAIFYYFRQQYKKSIQQFNVCLNIRANKLGQNNWQNTLTMLKIINYFQYSSQIKQQLHIYKSSIEDSYVRFKNYPFFWKISLANYYLNKDCEKNCVKMIRTIQYLQNALKHLEKNGFVQKSLYSQYCQIYDIQYSQFYDYAKPYLQSRLKLIKCKSKRQRKTSIRISKTEKTIQSQVFKSNLVIGSQECIQKKQLGKLINPPMLRYHQFNTKENQTDLSIEQANLTPIRSQQIQRSNQTKRRQDFERMTQQSIPLQSPSYNQIPQQKTPSNFVNSSWTKKYKSIYCSTQSSGKIAPNSEIQSSPFQLHLSKKRSSSRNSYRSYSKKQYTNGINNQIKSQMAILQTRRASQIKSFQQKYQPISHKISVKKVQEEYQQKTQIKKSRRTYINAPLLSKQSGIKHQKGNLQNPERLFSKIQFQQNSKSIQIVNKVNNHIRNSRIKKKS